MGWARSDINKQTQKNVPSAHPPGKRGASIDVGKMGTTRGRCEGLPDPKQKDSWEHPLGILEQHRWSGLQLKRVKAARDANKKKIKW